MIRLSIALWRVPKVDSVRQLATFSAVARCRQSSTTRPETKTSSEEGYGDCLLVLNRFEHPQLFKTRWQNIIAD
ncbi:hypothetical protein TNCV_4339741 [Trichonephila clavipes]|nr:hypothetical protein TNCV_4339741 [Trichonephila clavipes]